jgi:CelD/BcsL family acetyltransferase involved in cellulose biosynthesis
VSIPMLRPAFATFPSSNSSDRAPRRRPAAPTLATLRTIADVDAIAGDWRALAAATPDANGFQSFEWCRAWMAANGSDRDTWRIVTLREDGRLVALWPLQCDRLLGARILRWLGEPWTQYGDALALPGPQRYDRLALVWRAICAFPDIDLVKLGRLRQGAAVTALPALAMPRAVYCEMAPFVDLARKGPPPKADKRLRARRRRLEAIGPVRFEIVSDADARLRYVREAVALKRDWLAARKLASTGLWHPALDALMEDMAPSDILVVGRLSVDGRTAAIELGLHSNGGFRSLLGCHDPAFATGSPGHLLIGHMIDWSRRANCRLYDLMVPADPYKAQWSNDCVTVADHATALTLRGTFAALWFRARPALKALYRKLPQGLRHLPVVLSTKS